MAEKRGDHAVVLGASMAGLLAARVLTDTYRRVTVVERDPLPPDTLERKGLPQARHGHNLLPVGNIIIAKLFPNAPKKFAAKGVPVIKGPAQVWFQWEKHLLSRRGEPRKFGSFQPSRPYLDSVIREELSALPGLTFRDDCAALGLTASDDRRRVTGVRLAPRGGEEETLAADLVVDATGRGSRSPVWLNDLGYDAPDEERLEIDIKYSSRRLRLKPDATNGVATVVIGAVPNRPRAMALFAHEDDQFLMTLGGYAGHHPPTDHEGFLAFAEPLAPPWLTEALRDAEWLDEPRQYRYPASRWMHYERLTRFPDGFLVTGDGICSFNPLLGQGMSIAALEALALRDVLAEPEGPGLANRFFAAAARPVAVAWRLAGNIDRSVLKLPRSFTERLISFYVDRLQAAATHDPDLALAFLQVSGLLKDPRTLVKPRVVLRVLRGNLIRRPAEG